QGWMLAVGSGVEVTYANAFAGESLAPEFRHIEKFYSPGYLSFEFGGGDSHRSNESRLRRAHYFVYAFVLSQTGEPFASDGSQHNAKIGKMKHRWRGRFRARSNRHFAACQRRDVSHASASKRVIEAQLGSLEVSIESRQVRCVPGRGRQR